MASADRQQLPLDRIDLDGLAEALRRGGDAYLDPATGRVHAYRDEAGDDAIRIGSEGGGGSSYGEIQAFVDRVTDPKLKEELDASLDGRRLFSDFGDVIDSAPGNVRNAWHTYRGADAQLRALAWLERRDLVARSEIDAKRTALRAEAQSSLKNL